MNYFFDSFIDFNSKSIHDKLKIFYKYNEKIDTNITLDGDTLIIESKEIYNEMMNRKFKAEYNRIYFVRDN